MRQLGDNKLYTEYRDIVHESCGRFHSHDSHALIVKLSLSVFIERLCLTLEYGNISSNEECHTKDHLIVD